ncbi:ubiquinol-cytochrome C chaperone family protein [Magnetovibrio sp. PR-2]|uniref:ubiquinol-cytochrome C chaperone family protein n=1 Tax=Magnetovibrio sp. PR-2 TaxID=3120356 RepID=UPI002FCE5555
MFIALLKKLGFIKPDPAAVALYTESIKAARRLDHFTEMGVPDTLEGRFDMLSLVVSLLNRRIGLAGRQNAVRINDLAQELFDVMFMDIDSNLRESGVSDEGMRSKIKPMASQHLGRVKGYADALAPMDEQQRFQEMKDAVLRNVYRDTEDTSGADKLARRAIDYSLELDGASDEDILAGRFTFQTGTDQ